MNKIINFVAIIAILFFAACSGNNGNDEVTEASANKKMSELKAGDKFEGMTIKEVHSSPEFSTISFSDEIVVEGKVSLGEAPPVFYIEKQLFSEDLALENGTLELTKYKDIALNGVDLMEYLPAEWFDEGINSPVMKESEVNKHSVKILVKNILFESDNRFPVQAEVTVVLAVDGKKAEKQNQVSEVGEAVSIHFNDITEGMDLGGMKVVRTESQENDHFNIQFEGEFIVEGNLIYNEFEDTYFFQVGEDYHKKYTIKFPQNGNDQSFEFYSQLMFNFNSREELKKAFGSENMKKAQSGTPVALKIKAKNLNVGATLGKGMLGVGGAEFVSLL